MRLLKEKVDYNEAKSQIQDCLIRVSCKYKIPFSLFNATQILGIAYLPS